jgi:mannose-P-dolichol utilization defect protein 1
LGGFALNVVLAAQMLFYWNSGSKTQSEAAQPKKQQLAAPAATTPTGRKSPKPKSGGRKKA